MKTTASPFSDQANLDVELNASGIKGDGLTATMPELRKLLDGSKVTNGQFTAHFKSDEIKIAKRGPAEFDFRSPIDLGFVIAPVEFRAAPDGQVLAGVQEVRAEKVHFDPKTGAMRAKSLEITKPIGYVMRDSEGIHILGCVIK